MIESATTINALRIAIRVAAGPTRNLPEKPEIVDARSLLAAAESAASTYGGLVAATTTAYATWRKDYEAAFKVLDRHSRYVLSLGGTSTSEIAFTEDTAAHDTLVTRATTAAASGAPSDAKTDLARYRTALTRRGLPSPRARYDSPTVLLGRPKRG